MLSKAIVNSREAFGHPLEVRHYGVKPGVFELYEDDGTSYDHERGAYRLRGLGFAAGKGTETVRGEGPALFGAIERWVDTLSIGVPCSGDHEPQGTEKPRRCPPGRS